MPTTADQVIAYAQSELGKPYVFGAEGPNSFDCSGLMQYVFGLAGVKLPRLAHEQQNATTPVATPQPGDLVFWGKPAYHVALYIGNGKIIAAPDVGENVQIQNIWGQPSGYGRVSGVNTVISQVQGAVGGALGSVADSAIGAVVQPLLDGAKGILYPSLFAAIGGLLVVGGGWLLVRPYAKEKTQEASKVIGAVA